MIMFGHYDYLIGLFTQTLISYFSINGIISTLMCIIQLKQFQDFFFQIHNNYYL